MKTAWGQSVKQILRRILRRLVLPVVISTIIVTAGFCLIHGIPLTGIPKTEDLSSVEILDLNVGPVPNVADTEEEMELAVNIANFLAYEWGTPAEGEASVIITYHKKDGSTVELSANTDTVYWRGKARKIKGDNGHTFVNVTEGVFFSGTFSGENSS